jgi:putative nucleotidyltransferase with HDIG domain
MIEVTPEHYTLHDPHSGEQDLANQLIKTVGDPHRRFQEDALRMLRAIRFSVQLNMRIEAETYHALQTHHELLSHISLERIRDEFLKMLVSNYPKEAIELLDETQLLYYIIPELLDAKGVKQGGHHTTDVWTHSLDALAECPSSDPVVKLAALLHDISKPETFALVNSLPTFYNHEILGSRKAKKIAQRLRLSNFDVDRIFILVRHHMFHYQPEHTDAAIRRFMRKVGLENIDDMLDLREGDRLGSGARKTSWRLEEMKERMIEQLHQPMDVTDLAINGTDLMTELQLVPGPVIGKLLHALFEQVLDNPELNTKERLIEKARLELATLQ